LPLGLHDDVAGIFQDFIDGIGMSEIDYKSPLAIAHPRIAQSGNSSRMRFSVVHGDVQLTTYTHASGDRQRFLTRRLAWLSVRLFEVASATVATEQTDRRPQS